MDILRQRIESNSPLRQYFNDTFSFYFTGIYQGLWIFLELMGCHKQQDHPKHLPCTFFIVWDRTIPYFTWHKLEQDKSLTQNVDNLFFTQNAPLSDYWSLGEQGLWINPYRNYIHHQNRWWRSLDKSFAQFVWLWFYPSIHSFWQKWARHDIPVDDLFVR